MARFVEDGGAVGSVQVDLQRARPPTHGSRETRRRPDPARSADGNEHVARVQRRLDALHPQRDLAEPDHMRPQPAHGAAGGAGAGKRDVVLPRAIRSAFQASGAAQLPMHVVQAAGARAFVQVIHILRDQQEIATGPGGVEPGQGLMRWVGRHIPKLRPPGIVEALHMVRVGGEGLGRCHLLQPHPGPDAPQVAEGGEPAFGRNAGSGEDDEVHARHPAPIRAACLARPDSDLQAKRPFGHRARARPLNGRARAPPPPGREAARSPRPPRRSAA
ncbi:hypothetical protein GGQ83_001591 [Roseococcus suduntuyensis]|uniref:Uncharacterized protein n=1 Tax=Roseococcus suduntuyensis TaxID=455361 RepID=A0A840AD39_9PROT|nr:hypothetical protein [Roseococcus suduntuyensis]